MRLLAVLGFAAFLSSGKAANCGLQPAPIPAGATGFSSALPPSWWTPSAMQCGNATPYPFSSWIETPDCPDTPNTPWSSMTCDCWTDSFKECPITTVPSQCSKNASTGRFDSVSAQCYGVLQPRWNWILSTCDSVGSGGPHPIGGACALNPFTALDVRYVASYQLVITAPGKAEWRIDDSSSINTDGSQGRLANMTSMMGPSPGALWGAGYYPRATSSAGGPVGVGPPGMLFVLSLDRGYNFAWFLLNQLTLDRCPDCSKPNCKLPATDGVGAFNCWGDAPGAEAGEIDLLESPFWSCKGFPELCDSKGYGRSYVTSGNSKGFCDPKLHSAFCNVSACGMGGHGSLNYFDQGDTADEPKPHIYAAVVDAVGITIYRDPVWPGLQPGRAAPTLTTLRPSEAPQRTNPPCPPSPASCARFSPVCVTQPSNATTYAIVPREQSRLIPCPGQGSFGMSSSCVAGSWWNGFADTGQWEVDVAGKEPQ